MRRVAAVVLALALASEAPAGDATQECRDAWAVIEGEKDGLSEAARRNDHALAEAVLEKSAAAMRRFRVAFAAASWNAFDDEQDAHLLDVGWRTFIDDARARGDLAAARRGATEFATRRWSDDAFMTRGITLPELDLVAGDVDTALAGFRIGARQPRLRPHPPDAVRGVSARLRSGDVLAACGDAEGAKAEYALLRKAMSALDTSNPIDATIRDYANTELRARELLGKSLPALPKSVWIGGAPADAPKRVVVVWAGQIARSGDAGRLRELDRLGAETGAIDVRILATPGSVGDDVSDDAGGAFLVRIPRGPDDGGGEVTGFDGKDAAGIVATIRERLKLRLPVGVAAEGLPAPFDASPLLLVADRTGTIVHASVAGDHTDWVCGLARVVAAGKKLSGTARPRPPADEALATCRRNLTAMASNYPEWVKTQRLETSSRVPRVVGPEIWFELCLEIPDGSSPSERLMLCPADEEAFVPVVAADSYLWDEADRENPPAGLCSYAGRDFKGSPPGDDEKNPVIGACLHHPGGAVVARADGTVSFVALKELGLASDGEKTAGPDSKSPLLRVLR